MHLFLVAVKLVWEFPETYEFKILLKQWCRQFKEKTESWTMAQLSVTVYHVSPKARLCYVVILAYRYCTTSKHELEDHLFGD